VHYSGNEEVQVRIDELAFFTDTMGSSVASRDGLDGIDASLTCDSPRATSRTISAC